MRSLRSTPCCICFVVAIVELPFRPVTVVMVILLADRFVVEFKQGIGDLVQRFGAIGIQAIATFQIPQTVVTFAVDVVEVTVRIRLAEPARAEVAEMRIALETFHVIASHPLLAWSVARGTRSRVHLEVLLGRLLLGRQFGLPSREAANELAMPALFADAAEGVVAVFADGHTVRHRRQLGLLSEWIKWHPLLLLVVGKLKVVVHRIHWFWMSFGPCGSLTPLSGAVDGRLVRF